MPSRRSGAVATAQMGARIERDGWFEFPNVSPGDYVLQASRHRSAAWNEGESSTQFVTVNGVDVPDLVVRTATGSTVDGRIAIEGGGAFGWRVERLVGASRQRFVTARWRRPGAERGRRPEFHLAGLTGPRRLLVSQVPRGWQVQAIVLNDLDVTDAARSDGRVNHSPMSKSCCPGASQPSAVRSPRADGRRPRRSSFFQQTARRGIRNRASFSER
jgi:hypothetical protein